MGESPGKLSMSIQEHLSQLTAIYTQKAALLLQIPDLISPLSHDSQRVLQEGHNDQEASNCRQMGLQGLRVDLNIVFHRRAESPYFFEGVIWVGSAVARRRPCAVRQPMGIGIVGVGVRAGNVDSGGHGGSIS